MQLPTYMIIGSFTNSLQQSIDNPQQMMRDISHKLSHISNSITNDSKYASQPINPYTLKHSIQDNNNNIFLNVLILNRFPYNI